MDVSAPSSTAPAVEFEKVSRRFGAVRAVDGVDLVIAPGEFFAMLGPSGSGKTTCLRLIAGFEQPDAGEVRVFGEPMTGVPAHRRAVNTVFQDYALFPHLSVADNVGYGPMLRGVDRPTRRAQAEATLALVKLEGFGDRKPAQLSGGQRQRVALARALVNEPKVLLLDEPLGALDLKLRVEMQGELKALQHRLGVTFVFVTHDQTEALAMADRIAVFDRGRLRQVGAPREVYERPATRFVAEFVGGANVIEPRIAERLGLGRRLFAVRPETVAIGAARPDEVTLEARVLDVQYQGATCRVALAGLGAAEGLTLVATAPAASAPSEGETVAAALRRDALRPIRDDDVDDAAAEAARAEATA